MKKTVRTGHTIRFRRWSRKAYAAFASIGRWVTIGRLRKNVVDKSLSKQRKTESAGHAGCCEEKVWKGAVKSGETDIGIPPGGEASLLYIAMGLGTNSPALSRKQLICPCTIADKQETYILRERNNTGMDRRNNAAHKMRRTNSGHLCLFLFIHLITEEYDCK